MENETLGHFLRSSRERSGLSMGYVARALGVSVTFISDLERDQRTGSAATVKAFADLIGLDPDELVRFDSRILLGEVERAIQGRPEVLAEIRRVVASVAA